MKKTTLLFIFSLLPLVIYSQDFRVGFVGGLSMSQVDGDSFAGYNKVGANIGAFVTRKIAPSLDLQLDISYIQKGSRKTPNPENGEYFDYEIDLNYIQMPVVARYYFNKLSVEGGIAVGVLINYNEYENGQSYKDVSGVPPFKTMEYATVVGLNYHFSERFWVNARFLYSINRIRVPFDGTVLVYDPKPHWLSRKPGEYNNNIVFSLYYAINRLH